MNKGKGKGSGLPTCIGIILDGNRRWARSKGLPQLEGHRAGYENLITCARAVHARGIPHLVVYAFSTENWKRAEEEVSYLMRLLSEAAKRGLVELAKENIRVRFVGLREMLPRELQGAIDEVERVSAKNDGLTFWVCLSYGSRAEMLAAARSAAAAGEEITEESFRKHFWSAEMPDPDIIIRTGGEKRLSNFLLWQAAYSELFFLDKHWPDFGEADLDAVLAEYTRRERRLGG